MRVSELISRLQLLNQDARVLISSDEEGNRINILFDVEPQKFAYADDGSEVDLVHPDDEGEYEDDELLEAVVLWP